MTTNATRTYVLVHGAWNGGWVWRDVAGGLRAAGHDVTTPTLTGARRAPSHRSKCRSRNAYRGCACPYRDGRPDQLHVGRLELWWECHHRRARPHPRKDQGDDLSRRLRTDRKALADYVSPEMKADWEPHKAADKPLLPLSLGRLGVAHPAHVSLVTPRLVQVKALKNRPDVPIAYIRCTGFDPSSFRYFEEVLEKDPKVRTDVIDTGHFCMLTEPDETIRLLDKYG